MSVAELRVLARARRIDLTEERYVLKEPDGDFVQKVENTGNEAAKRFFSFTKQIDEAEVFSYNELWNKSTIGFEFVAGFAGGRAIRLKRKL